MRYSTDNQELKVQENEINRYISTLNNVDITAGLNALAHRGKDAEGKITFDRFNLGHKRLSILDLDKRSNQPFIYKNSALVYNGELWNYLELKQQLITNKI